MASMTGLDTGGDNQTTDLVQIRMKMKVIIHSNFAFIRMPEHSISNRVL